MVKGIGLRLVSAVVLSAMLGLLFWLKPDAMPAMFGADTPERALGVAAAFFLIFWLYLLIQGYPVSHGEIGSSSTHNLDNIVSGLPGVVALFGVFLTLSGLHKLSFLNLMLCGMTLAVVWYDMWILGGAASKINRLTDEVKMEK